MWHVNQPTVWPEKGRLPFRPGDIPNYNACVGWVLNGDLSMHGYIEGYAEAACLVFEGVRGGYSPDYLVFPLAHLWRQHVELALKNIVALGRRLAENPGKPPAGHVLADLWAEAREHIRALGDEEPEDCIHVDASIQELHRVDARGDGFRYPTRLDATRSLPGAPDMVNVEVFHDALCRVANFLSAVTTEMNQRLEYMSDMRAEMAADYSGW